MDEERRQKLRKLEAGMIEYRESLEERGLENYEKIVALQRKKLEAECGLLQATPALPSRGRDSKEPDSGLESGDPGASDKASEDQKERRDDRSRDRGERDRDRHSSEDREDRNRRRVS